MKKKLIAAFLAGIMVFVCLTGCGKESSGSGTDTAENTAQEKDEGAQETAETTEKKSNVTLTVAAAQDWIKDWDRKVAEDFTAETGIKIDFQLNPNDQYVNIVKAKLASGEGVDIFYANTGQGIFEYSPDKYALDLSDQAWVENYTDWGRDCSTYDGKVIFFSNGSIDGYGLLYNMDLLKETGKEIPTTYEELVELCDIYMDMGIVPIFEPGAEAWHGCVWVLEMADFLSRKYPDMIEKLNTPEGKFADYPEILTFTEQLENLVRSGYFGEEEDWLSYTWNDRSEKMASGEFGMMLTNIGAMEALISQYPENAAEKWQMGLLPLAGNNTFSHNGGNMGRIINKESKYTEEAKMYFDFMARQENLQYLYDSSNNPNCAMATVELSENVLWESLMKACNNVSGPDFAASIPFYNADAIGKAYVENWIGDKTPEEVIQQIDSDRAMMFGVTE